MEHDHSSHGSMPPSHHSPAGVCSMSMTWSTSWRDVCVVFPSWRLTTGSSLLLTLLALALIAASFEYLRMRIREMDARLARGALGEAMTTTTTTTPHRRKASLLPSHVAGAAQAGIGSGSALAIGGSDVGGAGGRGSSRRVSRSASSEGAAAAESLLGDQRGRRGKGILSRHVPVLDVSRSVQLKRSLLYGLSVSISFFLMLVVMTYSAYLVGAVLVGAIAGHYLFSRDPLRAVALATDDKGMACH